MYSNYDRVGDPGRSAGKAQPKEFNLEGTWLSSDGTEAFVHEQQKMTSGVQEYMCRINTSTGIRGTMRTMNNQRTVMRILGGKTTRGELKDDLMIWTDGSTWSRHSDAPKQKPLARPAANSKSEYKKKKPKLDWNNVLAPKEQPPPAVDNKTPEAGNTTQDTETKQPNIIKVETQNTPPSMAAKETKKSGSLTPVNVELAVVSPKNFRQQLNKPESPKLETYDVWSSLEMQAAEQIMVLEELIDENTQYSAYLKTQVTDQSLANVDFEQSAVRQKTLYRLLDNLETQRKKIDREVDEPELLEAALQNRNLMLSKMKGYAEAISEAIMAKDGAEMARKEERYELAYFDLMDLNKVIANYEFERVKQYKAKIEFAETYYPAPKPYEEFKKFWYKVFGVKLQELLFEDCMLGYNLLEDNLEKQMVSFDMFLMFLAHEHEVESAAEALNLIKDNMRMEAHFTQERFKARKLCFFFFLWIALLIFLIVHQGGESDRYLQTKGVRQVLFETIENDHQFEHTTNIGLTWIFLKKVMLPFLYGTKEYMSFGEAEYGISADAQSDFDTMQAVNPYLLGGVRLRQLRLKRKNCESPSADFFKCASDEYDTSDWTMSDGTPIKYETRAELEDQTIEFPWTAFTFPGGGYKFDLVAMNNFTLCDMNDGSPYPDNDMCAPCNFIVEQEDDYDGWSGAGAVPLRQCEALAQLETLQGALFIDDLTRVLFVDFNLYNPSKQLHTVARLQFEMKHGTVYPSMNIGTVNFFAYKSKDMYVLQFGFIALVVIFIGLHAYEIYYHITVLGGPAWFPACCGCPNDGKIPVHLSKHEMLLSGAIDGKNTLSFMEWRPKEAGKKAGVLKLALGKTTGLRVMLSQENLTRMVQRSLERIVGKDQPSNMIRVTKVTPHATDHGGVDVLLHISGLPEQSLEYKRRKQRSKKKGKQAGGGCCGPKTYPVGHLTFDEHEKIVFRLLAEDLESNLDTDQHLQAAVVLVRKDLEGLDYLFGNGLAILYSSFWSFLDLILVILFVVYITWDLSSWFGIDEDEFVSVDEFKSFRQLYHNYEWELLICFLVTWMATLKLIQALMSINRHVSMFWSMLKKSSGHLLNFIVLLFVIVLTFAMSGWALFSGQVEEFRSIGWTIWNLMNFSFDALYFTEVVNASFLGLVYYIAWGVLMPFILINVFIAILMTAWDETVTEHELASQGPEERKKSLLAKLFPYFDQKVVEGDIQKMGPASHLTDPKHWRKVYPAGCPKRKLMAYLEQQLGIREEDAEQIVRFVDTDDSGTFEWSELNDALKNLKPSLENSLISLTRLQTTTLRREQLVLKEEMEKLMRKLNSMSSSDGENTKMQIDILNQKIDALTDLTASMISSSSYSDVAAAIRT